MLAPEKRKYVIDSSSLLKDALAAIEENRHRSLIVVSEGDVVAGTLSDGDIRKALLDGRLMVAPVRDLMNTRFISLRKDETSRAAEIFAKTHIFLIPVVDERSRLLDVIEAY